MSADPTLDFFQSGADPNAAQAASAQPTAAAANQPASNDPTSDFFATGKIPAAAKLKSAESPTPTGEAMPDNGQPKQGLARYMGPDNAASQVAGNIVGGMYHSVVGGWKGLGKLVSGEGVDAAAQAIQDEQAKTNQPEAGSSADKVLGVLGSKYNPLNWPAEAAHKAGDFTQEGLNKAADFADKEGYPKTASGLRTSAPYAATTVETAGNLIPMLNGVKAVGAARTVTAGEEAAIAARAAAAKAGPTGATAELTASGSPRAGYFEPHDPAAPETPPVFHKEAPAVDSGALDQAHQQAREDILKRVGVSETRESAIKGDAQQAANEYQESKLNSPAGQRMKAVLDHEKQALSEHADSLVSQTGGTEGSAADEATRVERGNNILAPLDALKEHFDTATKALYDEADKRAAGVPVKLDKFNEILNDDSEMTNSDRVHLRQGLNSYLGKLKMTGEDGSVAGQVAQAETVRKYLNENWSPQNSKLVGKLKNAIDDDVTKSAGDDVYAQARQMRALRARTLDDPNGIAKIMDSSGPNGINRSVPTEKVADTITSMPIAQLDHIVGTLKNLPPELQEQGNAAINEIRAHMASKIADSGQSTASMWNAKGVNQTLTKNSARMKLLFTPEELSKFGDLNDAGNILKKDQSYPGAAVQEHNLVRAGSMAAIRGAGAGAGHMISSMTGLPGGNVVGAMLGEKAAGKFSERQARKNVESRIRQLQ